MNKKATRFSAALIITAIALGSLLIIIPQQNNNSNIFKENSTEKMNYPNQWMDYQRAYPHDHINPEAYYMAMHKAKIMQQSASRADITWELAGPTNTGGRITDLAFHPDDINTIFVGAATGGIFKSTNGGSDWEQVFEEAATISIGDLAVDPNNPDVVYAGTGEANSSSYSFLGDGIYKSTDGGNSWAHSGLGTSAYIGRIIVDYNNSERLFVAACGYLFSHGGERGIYRSVNGGQDWERVLYVNDSTSAIDIVQHPTDPDILYAAMWERRRGLNYRRSFGDGSGLWKTTDGGDTWNELTNGLPTGINVGRIGLDIAKSNPEVLYAFYDMPSQEVRVYRTDNAGANWTRTNDGSLDEMNSSFGWYFGQIRIDPADEDIVYALGVELHRTMNGGNTWEVIADYNNTYEIHVDHHAMFIDENTGRIFEGNDGGFYYSDDYGDNWTKINNLPITQFYYITTDFQNPTHLMGGTQDNNTIRTITGSLNDWFAILGGDGFYCLIDYLDNDNVFAESQWGNLYKSENGGYNFEYISYDMYYDRKNWMAPLVMDPINPEVLYFGTHRVWKTTDGGSDWNNVSGDLTKGGSGSFHTLTTLAISSVNRDYVMAGSADGKVHISLNAGEDWMDISEGLPNRWITRVAFDPFEENTVYATVSGFRWEESEPHVFKSTNLGENWSGISGNLPDLPVNVITLDPSKQYRIFVGTDAGVFYTEDGGNYWESMMTNIPNAPIVSMELHDPSRTLIIGTYGISAYKMDLDQLVNINEKGDNETINLTNYPNPVRMGTGNTNITFNCKTGSYCDLSVYNINGQKIKTLFSGETSTGLQKVTWDLTNQNGNYVKPGNYVCKLSNGKNKTSIIIQITQ